MLQAIKNSRWERPGNGIFPLCQFPFGQFPTLSTLAKWELTKWELPKWEVDQMGIDKVGIDKVGIDEVGINPGNEARLQFEVPILLSVVWTYHEKQKVSCSFGLVPRPSLLLEDNMFHLELIEVCITTKTAIVSYPDPHISSLPAWERG